MKKAILVVLTILLFISISGCGASQKKEIDSALQGTWKFTNGVWYKEFTFKKGEVKEYYNNIFNMADNGSGKYEINTGNETIDMKFDEVASKEEDSLDYSYNSKSGELTLWLEDVQGEKVK